MTETAASSHPPGPAPLTGHEIVLVRHGETEWSRDKKHTSRSDIPLTEVGERQAGELAAALAHVQPVLVLSSPRSRATRTAELAGLRDVVVDDDVREWEYGEYEGITTAEIRRNRPGWTIWTGDPPGGETAEQVTERADRALARISAALGSGDVIVVGHGHFNRVLGARWLGLPAAWAQHLALDTATICVLGHEHEYRVVWRWNVPAGAATVML